MKKLEFSLYVIFQNIFKSYSNKFNKFNLFDSFALCCIVVSRINMKENNI